MLAPPPELLVPREDSPPPPAAQDQDTVELAPRRSSQLRRRVLVAAAVVLAVVVGGVVGWQAPREPSPTEATGITWTATAPESDVRADVRLVDHEWGTALNIKMDNVPPGRKCLVMVYDHYGNREIGGWWGTDHAEDEEIRGSISIPRSKIDRLEFKLEDMVTFLTVPAPVG
jgi:hypothetical protein